MQDCIFCKIINKEIPAQIIYENDFVLAFKDISPVAPQHYLLIPKKHFVSLATVDAQYSQEILMAIQSMTQELQINDFRTVFNTGAAAGQTVFHVHAHIIAGRDLNWPPG
jgi:histidine triad (HIT) family protein